MKQFLICVIFLITANLIIGYAQEAETGLKKLLILHSFNEKRPFNEEFNNYLNTEVSQKNWDVDIFIENLDLLEFTTEEYKDLLEKTLYLKYRNSPPDFIVVTQPYAAGFVCERNLFSDIPKAFVLPNKTSGFNCSNVATVSYVIDFKSKIDHALNVFPETSQMFVVAGSCHLDQTLLAMFKAVEPVYTGKVEFKYITGIERVDILYKVKSLPENSLVFYLSYSQDLDGKPYIAKEFIKEIGTVCNRPVLSYLDFFTNQDGIFGGKTVSMQSVVSESIDIVDKVFNGIDINSLASVVSKEKYIYDWEEIKKWHVDINKLPPGSVFHNKKESFFEAHRGQVIGVLLLLFSYTILLLLLLFSIRKRKKSEKNLQLQNEEFAILNKEYKSQNEGLIEAIGKAERNQAELQKTQEIACLGTWYIDLRTNKVSWTDELFKMWNYTPDTLSPFFTDHKVLFKDESWDMFQEYMDKVSKTGDSYDIELEILRGDNSTGWIWVRGEVVYGENKSIIGFAGSAQDISERKQLELELLKAKEYAEESNRLKTEFISNMSHEIRTPMNGISGFSKLLARQNLSEEKRRYYITIIQNSGNQLLRIIDDILEISKLGTKQIQVIEREVCLNDLLLELFSIFDLRAKENRTPLYFKRGLSDRESKVLTDDSKLNKIISNLLENALKFTREGFIEFGYKKIDSELEIYVKDTGPGITPDKQDLIFERFSREVKDSSLNIGGLGLGLSIAKENAELLGGRITVESKGGEGSVFYVYIPYKPVVVEFDNNAKVKPLNPKKRNTILVAEDEEVNFLFIETFFEEELSLNCNILHAKNGKEAIDICRNASSIDLVLMDLKMPLLDGYEATKVIRSLFPNLPIVAQSAYTTEEDRVRAFSVGCNDFITKPLGGQALSEIIIKYLAVS